MYGYVSRNTKHKIKIICLLCQQATLKPKTHVIFVYKLRTYAYPWTGVDLNPNLVPSKFPPFSETQLSKVLRLSP